MRKRAGRGAPSISRGSDDIESKVNHPVVPLSYANELYTLKLHIDRVRARLPGANADHAIVDTAVMRQAKPVVAAS